ncbi:MAG: D-arabinose 5-phosphate [Alphaproteobacteria bacterium RIFCSPLOWO2_01_FULL_40_26]|nr:MAG: D-arabinose 5-phosphate [Alphaproteobacteria bacterium RIFCSPHIGHO2_02_FULL_40_34]OFW93892.1 MAG: D-arabinose 5-phosphate [Alphaproteobacteria bacterium RIFCSPLOWO2_01_FULL_40_26]OFX09165.1 MAG: D-arabinose 5-phosphate [Alphaproteobacteria bacterium RIFCSPLOWO2_02_FULL_40_19]OFX11110.1 MAG: D-arabinose 5-phosphate [Alphaproteobacteria bacterium RIFCSPLOWO2_12_FULL_40_11]
MQDKKSYISSAIATIKTEIAGLNSLLDFFGENYVRAVELILNCKGRIIVSGMGKSGHIAHKIAATFASTGTPSFFIHPGEASHGDLGMIASDDVVILLSNSGETKELKDIIYFCKRFEIPLIGIIRRAESELTKASTVPLILPAIPEANHLNAPTTSTTMMLALGDALAVSLIDARGFNSEKFGLFHPGGKLGSNFLKVKDLMRSGKEIPLVSSNKKMPEVLLEMTSKHLGVTGVVDEKDNLLGIITDGDLRRHIDNNFLNHNAEKIMTKNPKITSPDTLAAEAIAIMNKKSITSLFVLDEQKIVGILHLHDCLRSGVV